MASSATIYDVSRLSGVSTATVSRTFSDPDRVKEATRRKVYDAAAVLNYSPNAIARAMARQCTDRIAYIICKKGATILDEFYASICEGIMRSANRADLHLLVSTAEDWGQFLRAAHSKQIEGVILGGTADPALISEFQSRKIPVVLVNNRIAGSELPCVVADEASGVRQALEHLIQRGHRKIGMVAGRVNSYVMSERYHAFVDCLKEHGLPVSPASIKMCEATVQSTTAAAEELLCSPEARPTALFCINDVAAAGAYKAARRLGLRIPEDLAVSGFDDSTLCPMLEPELTSVHIDCRRMGELCVERLTQLLQHKKDIEQFSMVPTELIVRRST